MDFGRDRREKEMGFGKERWVLERDGSRRWV